MTRCVLMPQMFELTYVLCWTLSHSMLSSMPPTANKSHKKISLISYDNHFIGKNWTNDIKRIVTSLSLQTYNMKIKNNQLFSDHPPCREKSQNDSNTKKKLSPDLILVCWERKQKKIKQNKTKTEKKIYRYICRIFTNSLMDSSELDFTDLNFNHDIPNWQ